MNARGLQERRTDHPIHLIRGRSPDAEPWKYASYGIRRMKIRLMVDGTPLTATLHDHATTGDLLKLLPLSLKLEDFPATEKIGYLARKLSIAGAPAGMIPSPGDITYATWGNLALFYRGAPYAEGVSLGRIDAGLEALQGRNPRQLVIEAQP